MPEARPHRWPILFGVGAGFLAFAATAWLTLGLPGREDAEARPAREAIAAGRLQDAAVLVDRWLGRRPDSAEAHFLKARILLGQGSQAATIAELERAAALGYPTLPTQRLRAFALVLSGKYSEAEPLLVRVLNKASGPDPEADEALARVLLQTYKLHQAAAVLDRWIRDAPRNPLPFIWYTEIDKRLKADPAVAVAHYRAALERDPGRADARLGLAQLLQGLHRNAEAAREFAIYHRQKPDDPAGFSHAARNAVEMGDEAAAVRFLDRALQLAPGDTASLRARAAIDQKRGDFQAALGRLDRTLAIDPFDAEAHYSRGLVLSRLGRLDEARACQRVAGRLREEERQLDDVRSRLTRDPRNNDLRCAIARWMFDHGRPEEGLRWAETVLAEHPGHAAANGLVADHYAKAGEEGKANFYRLQAEPGATASHR